MNYIKKAFEVKINKLINISKVLDRSNTNCSQLLLNSYELTCRKFFNGINLYPNIKYYDLFNSFYSFSYQIISGNLESVITETNMYMSCNSNNAIKRISISDLNVKNVGDINYYITIDRYY